ncbi:hypothetical protein EYF80_010082 [Liparis tanakae]|uniref:Uncharacterized protein n=1 Tax=Liparis tanakae TaxID=230148 RepID=A0A4Z2IPV6_9TELE|nr:hypothetical protein EYF80_010082 [Liparis tanakae]
MARASATSRRLPSGDSSDWKVITSPTSPLPAEASPSACSSPATALPLPDEAGGAASQLVLPLSHLVKDGIAVTESPVVEQGGLQRAFCLLPPPHGVELVVADGGLILLEGLRGHGLLHLGCQVGDLQPLLLDHRLSVGRDVDEEPAHQLDHLRHVLHLPGLVAVQQVALADEVLRQGDGTRLGFCTGEDAPEGNQELGELPDAQQLASGLDGVGPLGSYEQDGLVGAHPGPEVFAKALKAKQFLECGVTSPGPGFKERRRLLHADRHQDSVEGGGERLQGRAASALQDLQQDVRGRVPAVVPPRAARHLPGSEVASAVVRLLHLTAALTGSGQIDSSGPTDNHHHMANHPSA